MMASQEKSMNNMPMARALSRRQFVITVAAGSAAAAALAAAPLRLAVAAEEAKTVDEAIKQLLGDKELADGAEIITLDLPQIAENGNTVPLGLSVESPMTADNYVKSVHIFADGNPLPQVASIHFTPASGVAQASTRMRLAKTQNVVAVAEMSDGSAYITKAEVKVTIGGCGG
jgi:sulfur-oxidizing protein SoxY